MKAQRCVSMRSADQVLAAAEAELRRGLWRLRRELAPKLAMRSATEITWIYRRSIDDFCDQMDLMGRAAILALPSVASRRLALVSPPEGQRRDGGRP